MPEALRPLATARRSVIGLLAVLPALACASSGGEEPRSRMPLDAPDEFIVQYRASTAKLGDVIPVPIERAWAALPVVFRELGFPAAAATDTRERVFMTPHLEVRGRLYPGERTSDYIDCGAGPGGNRADSYTVTFVIITTLSPTRDGQTRVETRVDGHARFRPTSGQSVPCQGTGRMEKDIVERLRRNTRS